MKLNFQQMMAQGVEAIDPGTNRSHHDDVPVLNRYFFLDNQTGIKVCYDQHPHQIRVTNFFKPSDPEYSCTGKELYRALVNRFLETFPSTRVHARMSALHGFLIELTYSQVTRPGQSSYSPHGGRYVPDINNPSRDIKTMCEMFKTRYRRVRKYNAVGHREKPAEPFGFHEFQSDSRHTKRADRFTDRDRNFRRFKNTTTSLQMKLTEFVRAFQNNCATIWHKGYTSESSHHAGWTYFFEQNQIKCYNDNNAPIRTIDLKSLDVNNESVIPVFNVKNCFCAVIEEKIGETFCLRLINKNMNTYGFACAEKPNQGLLNAPLVMQVEPQHLYARATSSLVVSSTKARAYAQMLARS